MQIVIFRRYRLEPGSLQEEFSSDILAHRRYVPVVWTDFTKAISELVSSKLTPKDNRQNTKDMRTNASLIGLLNPRSFWIFRS